jgi:hypothetical protein
MRQYTPEEQQILDERDRKQAEAKAVFRVELDKMVAQLKDAGAIKPCFNCGKDQRSSSLLALSGRKIESAPDTAGMFGIVENMIMAMHTSTILTCLVLTCENCGVVQFFDTAPFVAAAEKIKAEATAQ